VDVVSLGYRTDLALLSAGGSVVEDHGDHLVVRSPHNPTHWWGNFLLLAAPPEPEDAGRWLDRFVTAFPRARHVAFGVDGTDGRVGDLAAWSAVGLVVEAQAVMTAASVRPPPRLADALCRPLVSDADWAQSVELRVRCHDGPEDDAAFRAYAVAQARTRRQMVEAGHGTWSGAFAADDRLVCQLGLFHGGPGLARFQSVETDPDHRRRGLAGSLVAHVSRYGFEELGARTLVMVADPAYHALDLYRSLGFAVTQTQLQAELPRAWHA
jgi:ribosomal protein S18 acetylase RimI-like enzyme